MKSLQIKKILDNKDNALSTLRVIEATDLPIQIRRIFSVTAPAGSQRGFHAHKKCNQILICLSGKIEVFCDDGQNKTNVILDNASSALIIESGVWAVQKYIIDQSVLLVVCDQPYDESDYIRDYEKFIESKSIKL